MIAVSDPAVTWADRNIPSGGMVKSPMVLKNYQEAKTYLETKANMSSIGFPGEAGLARMRQLLDVLGSPDEAFSIVQIAGTSGKGSTAYLTAKLLKAHGFKTGLHMSPDVISVRERIQVDNSLIPETDFTDHLNQILTDLRAHQDIDPSYFELLLAMSLVYFRNQGVKFAVLETGLGGLLDGTNAVSSNDKTAVITRLGLDHTHILGNTLEAIAAQKAGIINHKTPVITIKQEPSALEVISKRALSQQSTLTITDPEKHFQNVTSTPSGSNFDYENGGIRLESTFLTMPGKHQLENLDLALGAVNLLAKRYQFSLSPDKCKQALNSAKLLGRFDKIEFGQRQIILDGAHNPQKMSAFISSLMGLYPGKRFTFLLGIKQSKDSENLLRPILNVANDVIFTTLGTAVQDNPQLSIAPEALAKTAQKIMSENTTNHPEKIRFHLKADPPKALDLAVNLARAAEDILVVTGSVYLLGEIYPLLTTEALTN